MTNINTAAYLAALMQAQVARGVQKKASPEEPKGRDASSKSTGTSAPSPRDVADLGVVSPDVLTQIATLTDLGPQHRRQAFRIFMQSKLAQQFDVSTANDSTFNQLVDEVLATMEADSELNAALLDAGQRLVDLALKR